MYTFIPCTYDTFNSTDDIDIHNIEAEDLTQKCNDTEIYVYPTSRLV